MTKLLTKNTNDTEPPLILTVILAIFLGIFGVHDIALKRYKSLAAHLLIFLSIIIIYFLNPSLFVISMAMIFPTYYMWGIFEAIFARQMFREKRLKAIEKRTDISGSEKKGYFYIVRNKRRRIIIALSILDVFCIINIARLFTIYAQKLSAGGEPFYGILQAYAIYIPIAIWSTLYGIFFIYKSIE